MELDPQLQTEALARGEDGRLRCWWSADTADYVAYHDQEWGRPLVSDQHLFEHLCLEGFQSGLSWLTILRKRQAFRAAFAGFDPERVARFGEADVARLLGDSGIVRNRRKIEAAIHNAARAVAVIEECGSLAALLWQFRPAEWTAPRSREDFVAVTAASTALAKELKRRGFAFVGPTTMHALLQACGLVNDHIEGCCVRDACEAEQEEAARTLPLTPPR